MAVSPKELVATLKAAVEGVEHIAILEVQYHRHEDTSRDYLTIKGSLGVTSPVSEACWEINNLLTGQYPEGNSTAEGVTTYLLNQVLRNKVLDVVESTQLKLDASEDHY